MRKNRELRIVFLGIVVLFAVFLVIPALQLLLKSVWGANGLTVEFYASVFAQKGFGAALRNSFVVSAAAAAAAVMLAFVIDPVYAKRLQHHLAWIQEGRYGAYHRSG